MTSIPAIASARRMRRSASTVLSIFTIASLMTCSTTSDATTWAKLSRPAQRRWRKVREHVRAELITLYWQKRLYATPESAGRKRDRAAFEGEFVQE